MTALLIRLFIGKEANASEKREKYGFLASWVGLVTNLLLFIAKLLTGLFTGSISIMADAINNMSDSASSVITLVGFKLSSVPADEQHPYGHARYEYISGLLVSCLVLIIGFQFLISSVQKTLAPEPIQFNWIVAVLLILSILAKLWQSRFYHTIGKTIESQVLLATSVDSRNDVITTLVVLVSAVLQGLTGWYLDGPIGIAVSLFLLYSGVKLIQETLTPLLGEAPGKKLVRKITEKVLSYPSVLGMHDLMVHSYGPEQQFASAHVEVPASQDIMVSHDIIDTIEKDVKQELGIQLVIHLDPIVTDDPELDSLKEKVNQITEKIDKSLSIHDFRMVKGKTHTNIIFEVTVPPRYKTTDGALRRLYREQIKALNPAYDVVITVDRSYTSTTS